MLKDYICKFESICCPRLKLIRLEIPKMKIKNRVNTTASNVGPLGQRVLEFVLFLNLLKTISYVLLMVAFCRVVFGSLLPHCGNISAVGSSRISSRGIAS